MSSIKTVKIFLASSEELVVDREEFEIFLSRKNPKWRSKNIAFDLVIWENFLDSVSETRKQDDYNRALEECDIFVLLFFTKVGKYTEEEFDSAYKQFKKTGKPKIFTYFKDAPIRTSQLREESTQSLYSFMKKLAALDHFYSLYESVDSLKLDFYDQLEKLELENFFGNATAFGHLDRNPLKQESPPDTWIKEYLNNTREDLKHVKVPIPIGYKSRPLRLEEVYVPLQIRLHHYSPETAEPDWTDLLIKERVAITGDAGSGKTTLLRYIALKVAQNSLERLDDKPPKSDLNGKDEVKQKIAEERGGRDYSLMIPIFIDLANAMDLWNSADSRVREVSPDRWLTVFKNKLYTLSKQEIEGLFKTGNVLFLFDGLDEVPEPGDRRKLINGIANLQRAFNPLHARNKVFVACRSAAWDHDNEFVRFERVEIQPMGPAIYQQYLWKWCRKVWEQQAQEIYDNLTRSISSSPAVAHIVSNPQMSTMLSLVQSEPLKKNQGVLPKQRALLYERFVKQFIKTGSGSMVGDKDQIRGHLIALALEMQLQKNEVGEPLNSIRVQDACNLLGKRVCSLFQEELNKKAIYNHGEELLHALEIHTGLLEMDRSNQLSQGNCYVRFKHRTFQEYLTACHYAEEDVKGLLDHAADPGWAETIAMACGLLSQFDESAIQELLEGLLQYNKFSDNRIPSEKELVNLAPRIAAATICFFELASYDLAEETLNPVRNAHNLMLPLLKNPKSDLSVDTRVKIAEGLGMVFDPRLVQEERWVIIPAGKFMKGSETLEAWIQEQPRQEVELDEFMIQRWPVTVREFGRFIEEGGYQDPRWWIEERGAHWRDENEITAPFEWDKNFLHGNRPVTGVSWWEAQAYCRWYTQSDLSLQKNWKIKLPTEEQWEKAAGGVTIQEAGPGGAGLRSRFPWGTEWDDNSANYSGVGPAAPAPVGIFPAGNSRPYDLWDMAGNVNEWCQNQFGPYTPNGGSETTYQYGMAVRGGSFQSMPLDLRITNRFGLPPDQRYDSTGFRCVAVRKSNP